MLFVICILLLLVSFWWLLYNDNDFVVFPLVISFLGVCISLVIIGINYIGINGYIDRMNVRYETLVYQYENDIYDNDNDLGKRELMVDIQDWNEDLAHSRAVQNDFWVGLYIPNIYDQFEFIELNEGYANE